MHIKQFSESSRTFTVAGLPVSHRDDLAELEITISYTGEGGVHTAHPLDHIIMPIIKAALTQPTPQGWEKIVSALRGLLAPYASIEEREERHAAARAALEQAEVAP